MNRKLFVGNLPFRSSADDIRDLFAQAGDVEDVLLIVDKVTARPRGFGFVTMVDEQAARKAIAKLAGADFQGRSIKVSLATDRGEDDALPQEPPTRSSAPHQLESRYHRRPALEKIRQYRTANRS